MADQLNTQDVFGGQDFLEKILEHLDSVFPQKLPEPNEPLSKIMYESGQRSVVEYIKTLREEKNVRLP
tara:strand:+ start:209 stop:412 length:204 start_codon:yes stop_codon:yes gene_type:complete